MLKKLKKPGRKAISILGILVALACGCMAFTGCRGGDSKEEGKIEDLDFTVAGEHEIPEKLKELVEQKREKPFKLTYADGQEMYVVIGAGPQNGGGFSIAVKDFYRTENSVVIRTELLGPDKTEPAGTDASYPVLIVKTAYREEPVVFR